jgi:hypothetical protein
MSGSARMMITAALLAPLLAFPAHAPAWEATSTHAGLAEQAATASHLHARLRDGLGVEDGLFAQLIVPPADAPELFTVLRDLDPIEGYVPDARGRLIALGWLAAGAVIADLPSAQAANHFFDPATGKGMRRESLGGLTGALREQYRKSAAGSLPASGMPAPDWVVAKENPLNLDGFLEQYQKAIRAGTPGERARHVAAALLAAGAILHVLQDMGSPSHVRDDVAAHLDGVGNDSLDLGSRFERIAAVAYGRLGVPAPSRVVNATTLRGFFTNAEQTGLADLTAARWFSAYTLPRSVRIGNEHRRSDLGEKLTRSLRRAEPAVPTRLNLVAAQKEAGVEVRNTDGVCLARYRVEDDVLSWFTDDECALEQLGAILPETAAYGAGLLDFLFRGELTASAGSGGGIAIAAGGVGFGKGTVEIYAEDERGVRTALGAPTEIAGAAIGASVAVAGAPAKGTRRVAAVFHGVDAAGEPLVASVTTAWPLAPASR